MNYYTILIQLFIAAFNNKNSSLGEYPITVSNTQPLQRRSLGQVSTLAAIKIRLPDRNILYPKKTRQTSKQDAAKSFLVTNFPYNTLQKI